MKNIFLISVFPILIIGGLLWTFQTNEPAAKIDSNKNSILICGATSDGNIDMAENGKFVTALPGWGKYSYKISTNKDSAQYYFNQGLNMYYGYHMKESLASFKEAARIDPGCAMTYWGQALAMGPYYNAAHTYTMPAGIQVVLQRMNETNAYDKEKDLIETMNRRYSADATDSKRKDLNAAYAGSMRNLISKYPDDQDIKMWYVDAVMLIHAWDFWNSDGSAKAWTDEVVYLSEKVLKENPDHPAALHYHIHLTEASRHPEVALPNADKLKTNLPGIAHMVHMSSHEYQRNGLYAKGVEVNDLADNNLIIYDSLAKNLMLNRHSAHYFAVQTYCAMSGGMYKTGMRDALRCRDIVSPTYESTYDQYLYMMPILTLVRLGKWDEILQDKNTPDAKWPYAGLLYNFAQGMAYINTGNSELAEEQLVQLREKAKDPSLLKRRIPFNAPWPIANIAAEILSSSILFNKKNYDLAIAGLHKAIEIEDALIYTEPNDWPIPSRQFLGAFLLKINKAAAAEKVYREDLALNPGNGWSLLGLCQSLEAQKKSKGLAEYKSKYLLSFSGADEIPTGSVYLK